MNRNWHMKAVDCGILEHAKLVVFWPILRWIVTGLLIPTCAKQCPMGRDNRGVCWGHCWTSDHASRLENRVGDTSANPFYMASQIISGLDGLEREHQPPEATETPWGRQKPSKFVKRLKLEESSLMTSYYGTDFKNTLVHWKVQSGSANNDGWMEQKEYFGLF